MYRGNIQFPPQSRSPDDKRKRGRPNTTWRRTIELQRQRLSLSSVEWTANARSVRTLKLFIFKKDLEMRPCTRPTGAIGASDYFLNRKTLFFDLSFCEFKSVKKEYLKRIIACDLTYLNVSSLNILP